MAALINKNCTHDMPELQSVYTVNKQVALPYPDTACSNPFQVQVEQPSLLLSSFLPVSPGLIGAISKKLLCRSWITALYNCSKRMECHNQGLNGMGAIIGRMIWRFSLISQVSLPRTVLLIATQQSFHAHATDRCVDDVVWSGICYNAKCSAFSDSCFPSIPATEGATVSIHKMNAYNGGA